MSQPVVHQSVLSKEVLELLAPAFAGADEHTYLDLNLGAGGHAALIASKFHPSTIVGIDTDPDAVAISSKRLTGLAPKLHLTAAWSDELNRVLDEAGIQHVSGALLDLGLRSDQLEGSGRGFSFRADEPLLMTMRPGDSPTAADLVNDLPEGELAELIETLGEEKFARRIAGAIVDRRLARPFERSLELAEVIARATPVSYQAGRIHPATRTFQALRIATNGELARLGRAIDAAFCRLAAGGRMLAISFHSLEDRIVKQKFAALSREGHGRLLTKKPIVPSTDEVSRNPRARSAKLRGIQKI
ncbi:MAG TPA: 16S rRNA (cytosine(1402)-N(4))-methyltransferase RsmH [Candidatus Paceibacterota bacterium]